MTDQPQTKSGKHATPANARSSSSQGSPSGDRKGGLYEFFERHGRFWITRHSGNHVFYATWYDRETKQTRR